jgi:hypothetical protein
MGNNQPDTTPSSFHALVTLLSQNARKPITCLFEDRDRAIIALRISS